MKNFICRVHGEQLDPYVWKNREGETARWCRACRLDRSKRDSRREYMREYRKGKNQYWREAARSWRERVRQDVLAEYGGKCFCCSEVNPLFLTIDHMNNDGHIQRKTIGASTYTMYAWLRAQGYPKDGYQLACFNCNLGRARNGGICPHVNSTT